MKFKKILRKVTPLRVVIALCCLTVCAAVILRITGKPYMPLDSAAPTVTQGDVLTVRIGAPEVSGLYGYQFRLEYDDTLFTAAGPQSLVADIPTIFKKDFDGYALVGATMTGDRPGYSAADVQLCDLKLTALAAGALPEVNLSKVNVVSSQLDYTEDIEDWTYEVIAYDSHP